MMHHVPDVMFLPLAAIEAESFGELDGGLLARRIPDFVHQLLNQGQHGPTGMLELQTAPDEGPVDWVHLDEPLSSDEAFDMLPAGDRSRAVVGGTVQRAGDQLQVEFHVFFAGDADGFRSQTAGTVSVADPVPGLLRSRAGSHGCSNSPGSNRPRACSPATARRSSRSCSASTTRCC